MMYNKTRRIILAAMATTVTAFAASPVAAQSVFRCGSAYQQQPCPGGAAVAVEDGRSAQQRAANLEAVARTSRMADGLEQSRLKAESQAAPVYLPKPESQPGTDFPEDAEPAWKAKKPAYFTARSPKPPKAPKAAKAPKAPKAPKVPKAPKPPKAARTPKGTA